MRIVARLNLPNDYVCACYKLLKTQKIASYAKNQVASFCFKGITRFVPIPH